jgi:DNA-binding CsgD family transcriptional regulator
MAAEALPQFPGNVAPVLVGREREQAVLRECLDATLAGQGGLVLIGGEAGIGKTALAEALLAETLEQGAAVLVGRCYDLSETPPYGPWREVFDRTPRSDDLPPLPAAVLPPERAGAALSNQEAILRSVRDYLTALAARHPLVLLLEDLHWADPASLDLLRVLARGIAGVPLLLLATYRAEEVARGHTLFRLLPALVREARVARLDLRPLDRDAIGALVTARYALGDGDQDRLVAYLAGRSDGNALVLGELLRTLEGEDVLRQGNEGWQLGDLAAVPVPVLLQQVIAGRLHRLPAETERLLALAAVIGQEVPLALWAAVAETDENALLEHAERATAAHLLVETSDGAGVRFSHALIREALYEGTTALRRRAWHRQAGEALLAAPGPDPDAVANQFQRAGDQRAVEWLVRAGLRACAGGASITAADRFVAAAGLLTEDAAHAQDRGWLLLLSGQLLTFADTIAALQYLGAAEPLAQLVGDRVLVAHICGARGMVLCHRPNDIRAGVAELERAVTAVEALPHEYRRWSGMQVALARVEALLPEGEAVTLPTHASILPVALHPRRNLANWYGWTGRYREAQTMGEAIVATALEDEPGRQHVPGRFGLAHAYAALGRPDAARREYGLWRAACYAANEPYVVEYTTWAELQHAVLPYQPDDPPERARLAAESARAWTRAQDTVIAAPYPSQAGLPVALLDGRWAEARWLAEAAVAYATVGHAQSAGAALGVLARWQGDPNAAWARVRALHPQGPDTAPGDCFFVPGLALQALAADLALDVGDLTFAGEWVAAHGRWLEWSGAVLWRAEHLLLRARYARAAGDLAQARAHADGALALASEPRQPLALLAAHRTLGELATDAMHCDEAATHLEAALALADACAAPYERALTLLALAELRHAEGRSAETDAALDAARTILAPLGAVPALARAESLAVRGTAPLVAPSRPGGLSRREAEVLGLLAAGRSNHEIARALSLSPRTVQRHIANAYLKIGAHNKADATAFALRHGLA